jgi:hypothetical protein
MVEEAPVLPQAARALRAAGAQCDSSGGKLGASGAVGASCTRCDAATILPSLQSIS